MDFQFLCEENFIFNEECINEIKMICLFLLWISLLSSVALLTFIYIFIKLTKGLYFLISFILSKLMTIFSYFKFSYTKIKKDKKTKELDGTLIFMV